MAYCFRTGYFYLLNDDHCYVRCRKRVGKSIQNHDATIIYLLIIVVVKSLSLDGSLEGVRYLLQPRVEDISIEGILFALGQSFFTLSLGTTGMITYASYAPKTMTIKSSAVSIVLMNILVSVLAGLAIFPALKTFGYQPQEGPGLLFKVLLLVFDKMHFGIAFYLMFLILFLFAALTSSISLLELNVSNFTKMIIRNVNLSH